jgi:hypothetical protein
MKGDIRQPCLNPIDAWYNLEVDPLINMENDVEFIYTYTHACIDMSILWHNI